MKIIIVNLISREGSRVSRKCMGEGVHLSERNPVSQGTRVVSRCLGRGTGAFIRKKPFGILCKLLQLLRAFRKRRSIQCQFSESAFSSVINTGVVPWFARREDLKPLAMMTSELEKTFSITFYCRAYCMLAIYKAYRAIFPFRKLWLAELWSSRNLQKLLR